MLFPEAHSLPWILWQSSRFTSQAFSLGVANVAFSGGIPLHKSAPSGDVTRHVVFCWLRQRRASMCNFYQLCPPFRLV